MTTCRCRTARRCAAARRRSCARPTISSKRARAACKIGQQELLRRRSGARPRRGRERATRARPRAARCDARWRSPECRAAISPPVSSRTIAQRRSVEAVAVVADTDERARARCGRGRRAAGRSCCATITRRCDVVSSSSLSIVGRQRLAAIEHEQHEVGNAARLLRRARRPRARRRPACRAHPAVSTSVTATPSMSIALGHRDRASCPATSVTIARSAPANALNRLDLPTFGRPAMTTVAPSRIIRPRARVRQQRRRFRSTTRRSRAAASRPAR